MKPIKNKKLFNKILEFRKQLIEEYNIDSLVFSVIERDSEFPIVVYGGDQLQYTALSVAVAKELRERVVKAVGSIEKVED